MEALTFYMMTPRPSHFFPFIEKHFIFNVLKNELQAKRQCTVSHCYVRCPQEKWKIAQHMLTVNQRGPSTDTWGSPDITHASSWAHRNKHFLISINFRTY